MEERIIPQKRRASERQAYKLAQQDRHYHNNVEAYPNHPIIHRGNEEEVFESIYNI